MGPRGLPNAGADGFQSGLPNLGSDQFQSGLPDLGSGRFQSGLSNLGSVWAWTGQAQMELLDFDTRWPYCNIFRDFQGIQNKFSLVL